MTRLRRGAILIPTYRRPGGLAKALAHITRLETSADLTVIVADNDPMRREGMTVARAARGGRFPIRCISVADRGVSHVRNALLAHALAEPDLQFVALIDDDEWPEPAWLERLVDMQAAHDADAVGGRMSPNFERAPAWAEPLSLYRQEQPDGLTDMIWGTCNALLTRRLLERMPQPWFDPEFGMLGGEDVDFFTRAKAHGARFAWANEARVFEDVPADRTTIRWVMRRSFRIGGTNAMVQIHWRYRRLGHAIIVSKAIGRLGAAGWRAVRQAGRRSELAEAVAMAARSFGEMAALLGVNYAEYGSGNSRSKTAAKATFSKNERLQRT